MNIVISSGHGKFVKGASSIIDEVTEARKVVNLIAEYLTKLGASVVKYHDDTSKTQSDNVNGIVAYHNKHKRDLDISVHFNAASYTKDGRGVEVLHYNDGTKTIATNVSKVISGVSGLKNRGAKKRTDLGFLKRTSKPAILLEICFVDSEKDVELYKRNFDSICKSIAETIVGKKENTVKTASNDDKVYRLFTGTFKTKESAEKVAEQIEKVVGLQMRIREE